MVVMLGVPDMGKVCAECHVPNYVDKADGLYAAGVDNIYCVAVAPPEKAESWSQKIDLKDSKVDFLDCEVLNTKHAIFFDHEMQKLA